MKNRLTRMLHAPVRVVALAIVMCSLFVLTGNPEVAQIDERWRMTQTEKR